MSAVGCVFVARAAGSDFGPSYRFFYTDEEQKETALATIAELWFVTRSRGD